MEGGHQEQNGLNGDSYQVKVHPGAPKNQNEGSWQKAEQPQNLSPRFSPPKNIPSPQEVLSKFFGSLYQINDGVHLVEIYCFDQMYYENQTRYLSEQDVIQRLKHLEAYFALCLSSKTNHEIDEEIRKLANHIHMDSNVVHFAHLRALKATERLFSTNPNCRKYVNLNSLSYNYDKPSEYSLVAECVKEAYEHDDQAFLFLTDYLVRLSKKMQADGLNVEQIQKKISTILNQLAKQHPPNLQKPTGDQLDQIQSIKAEKMSDHKLVLKLFQLNVKNQELDKFIIQIAQIAMRNLDKLIEATKSACLDNNGLGYKTGVKVKDSTSVSAIDRVKQKLLSKDFIKYKIQNNQNLEQFLENERQAYHKQLIEIFAKSTEKIRFTVSDMLRGKCMFRNVQEINKAAQEIIKTCQQRDYHIQEIDNRLRGKTADLVFKIEIGGIVAEFQLAYKFNAINNEFNHRIYQLLRSKFFSVISSLYLYNVRSKGYFSQYGKILQKLRKEGKQIRVIFPGNSMESIESLSSEFDKYRGGKPQKEEKQVPSQRMNALLRHLQKLVTQGSKIQVEITPEIRFMRHYRSGMFFKEHWNLRSAKQELLKCLDIDIQTDEQSELQLYLKRAKKTLSEVLNEKGQLSDALSIKISMLEERKADSQNQQKNRVQITKLLFQIGQLYLKKGDYPNALKYFEDSLQKQESSEGEQNIDMAKTLNNMGLVYSQKGDYPNALKCYEQSLKIEQRVRGKDSMDCAITLNNLGSLASFKGDYPSALKYYEESLQIQQKVKGKNSIDSASTLNNIGFVYKHTGDYANALKYYEECLQIEQKVKGKDSIDCALTLNNIGSVYMAKGQSPDALKYYEECLFIQQKYEGEDSIDCAITLNNIGTVYRDKKDYPNALKFYQQSLRIREKVKGKGSIDCANTLNNIGAVHSDKGDLHCALRYYQQSLKIRQKFKGKYSTDCAHSLGNIALLYRQKRDYQNALQCYEQILEIKQKLKGKQSADYALTLNDIGTLYQDMRKNDFALQFFKQAFQFASNQLPPTHKDYQKIESNYKQLEEQTHQ